VLYIELSIGRVPKVQGFAPDVFMADKPLQYGVAEHELALSAHHGQGLRRNNRAENSRKMARLRERKMLRFKSVGSAQRFLRKHAAVHNTFNLWRDLISCRMLHLFRAKAADYWKRATAAA
jgi:putative transposase